MKTSHLHIPDTQQPSTSKELHEDQLLSDGELDSNDDILKELKSVFKRNEKSG